LVNTFDYSNGGAMQLFLEDDGSSNGAESTGATLEGGQPPKLLIRYQKKGLPLPADTSNRPPVFEAIGDRLSQIGYRLSFTVNALDPDGGTLSYSATGLPPGASFDPATRTFSWSPETPGTFKGLRFSVTDGKLTDSEEMAITVVYPEVVKRVGEGGDDGFSGDTAFRSDATWFEVGNSTKPVNAWFRFSGIAIPQGATVLEARLETVQQKWAEGTKLRIYAEKASSPAAPANRSDYQRRTRTSASVRWVSGYSDGAWHGSPDFAAIIQELVNSYDYSYGGTMQMLIDDDGSAAGSELAGPSFEGGQPPRLYIKYQK